MKTKIALLDLDGVLIWPRGYRASVNASMKFLVEKMRLDIETPVEEIAPLFESLGITCEWDMLALLTTILLDAIAAHDGRSLPPVDLQGMLDWVRENTPGCLDVDFSTAVGLLEPHLKHVPVPSESIFLARQNGADLFVHLDHQPFLEELLNGTRDLQKSFTSMLFQNIVLGDRVFTETYDHPVIVSSPSLLTQHDEPAMLPEISRELMKKWREGAIHLSVFTARPSLPPRESDLPPHGFSPEAEMAVDLVGLTGIPIMGYGRLQWLTTKTGIVADTYMKPAPVQALAALRAAVTREEADSLLWAQAVVNGRDVNPGKAGLPQDIELHVFEDSAIGLIAGLRATEILIELNYDVTLHCWGIAKHHRKVEALQRVGAIIHPDVNAAMEQAFELDRSCRLEA